jgi:DME family drug/metabolite transporter
MEVFFALISAVAHGCDYYCIRKGLLTDPYPLLATFITLTVNFSFFLVMFYWYVPLELLQWRLIYPFVAAGVLAPGCARIFAYKGLEHLGMSISAPIINAETLFSVLMAIVFLNEKLNIFILWGIVSVITGLVMLSYEMGRQKGRKKTGKLNYLYIFYPLTAAVFYGISVFFRKLGLVATGSPILGATITAGTSWCVLTLLMMRRERVRGLMKIGKKGLTYFVMGGAMTCIAWLSYFSALNIGRVALVAPIVGSYSLVTMFFSYFFLRDVERITITTVVATGFVVGGIVLLIVGR